MEAPRGLPGMFGRTGRPCAVGEEAGCTRLMPVCGRLWVAGAADAGAGLLGELLGREVAELREGEVAAVAVGMSYFCSCSR